MKTALIIICSILSYAGSAVASDLKIGIVDMTRVFAEYHKTRDAEDKMKKNQATSEKGIEEMQSEYKALVDRYQALATQVKDPGLSQTLRKQKQKEGEKLVGEIRSLERRQDEEVLRRRKQLQEQADRQRKELMGDITKVIGEYAREQNYDLVFDRSGANNDGIPFLLYSKEATDFSADVIKVLNKEAP